MGFQNGTRNIILDYQDLLQREQSSQVFAPLPSRPSSSSSNDSSRSASRKHKQQMLLATKAASRPHTTSARARACSTPNGSLPVGSRRSAGAVRSSRPPSIPWRAQTAGAAPLVLHDRDERPFSDNNASLREDSPCDDEHEVRTATPAPVRQAGHREPSLRHGSMPASFFRRAGDADLFHFPPTEA
jgi:hypothetical protein